MINEFVAFINKHQLFSSKDRLLLAVSAGIDSIVLADLCHKAGYNFTIAHCNFKLRGEFSEADEAFVRSLAQKYGVDCLVKSFHTHQELQPGESVQMGARRLRYQWFHELVQTQKGQFVAVAHHKNDILETILFNLTKGTGIAGLRGIAAKRGHIVRPLLFAERKDIAAYAQQNALAWREDSSNASVKYARNLIRLEVVPKLLQINPALFTTLDATLERLQGTEKILRHYIEEVKSKAIEKRGEHLYMAIHKLQEAEALPLVLASILKPYGFNEAQVKNIVSQLALAQQQPGLLFQAENYTLNIDRHHIIVSPAAKKGQLTYVLNRNVTSIQIDSFFALSATMIEAENFVMDKSPKVAALDADKLHFPLQIRPWQAGDWFQPLGMKGKKKLSDFMIDHKIPLNLKDRVYVLLSGESIVWVIGYRVDERYKITKATRQVFQVRQENL